MIVARERMHDAKRTIESSALFALDKQKGTADEY